MLKKITLYTGMIIRTFICRSCGNAQSRSVPKKPLSLPCISPYYVKTILIDPTGPYGARHNNTKIDKHVDYNIKIYGRLERRYHSFSSGLFNAYAPAMIMIIIIKTLTRLHCNTIARRQTLVIIYKKKMCCIFIMGAVENAACAGRCIAQTYESWTQMSCTCTCRSEIMFHAVTNVINKNIMRYSF